MMTIAPSSRRLLRVNVQERQRKPVLRRMSSYEPLILRNEIPNEDELPPFSRIEYSVFLLLGVAMLWAWNMFLAAAPYFQFRFQTEPFLLARFQAAETSCSSMSSLASMLILAKLQANASYPWRINISLLINMLGFTLLAISTKTFLDVSPYTYFFFLISMVLVSSISTGFTQNGSLAFAAGIGRPEYMQAIMTGQAVAGVLPPIVQIASALIAAGNGSQNGTSTTPPSAFSFFLTATAVSGFSLWAFLGLLKRFRSKRGAFLSDYGATGEITGEATAELVENEELNLSSRKPISLFYLLRKLFYRAITIIITFSISMVYPVFTSQIVSTNPNPPALLSKGAFIPLALFVWSGGDLLGRLIPLNPRFSLDRHPKFLFFLALLRICFIPLYMLCNRRPLGSTNAALPILHSSAKPDWFYFLVVQLPFGISNGYLGTCSMMGAAECVESNEREAAGSFMGLMLVSGLMIGSLLSFFY